MTTTHAPPTTPKPVKVYAKVGQPVLIHPNTHKQQVGRIIELGYKSVIVRTPDGMLREIKQEDVLIPGVEVDHSVTRTGLPDEEDAALTAQMKERIVNEAKWPGQIWLAFDESTNLKGFDDPDHIGYLITDRHNPDALIAFIPIRKEIDGDEDSAGQEAYTIAEEPDHLNETATFRSWDLRRFAKTDSDEPTPEFLYRLNVVRDHEPARFARRLWPFCRFRMARLVEMFNDMHFTDEQREAYPRAIVGISDPNSGGHEIPLDPSFKDVAFTL